MKTLMMKVVMTMVMILCLTAFFGCMSPRGGGMSGGNGFKIAVPNFSTEINQGDRQNVTISLHRDENFKRDVTLEIRASKGISVEPTNVVVQASDTPDIQLRIAAAKDAAIGEYRIYVKGTPQTGESTSTEFKVNVVAP